MHIVERFTFDPQKFSLRRDYSVTDPVYLAAPYESYDVMYLSDVPFQKDLQGHDAGVSAEEVAAHSPVMSTRTGR